MNDNYSIIILGAGLTGLTAAFHLVKRGKKVLILEKNDRIGGQIRTLEKNGFVFETGPNTGTVSHPEVAELFAALSPACELENADENAKHRLIWKGDRFRELPGGLLSGVTTPIITWKDKFRILGEPFCPKGTNPDESVAGLALRRLGKSYLDYCVDPFISGIYAGDPARLLTRYALPKLYRLEQTYGSFIKGAVAKAFEPKTERDRLATKKIFSARGGLSNLTAALADAVGRENITLSVSSVKIQPVENHWQVAFSTPEGEKIVQAEKVITTVSAHVLRDILPFIEPSEMNKITGLRYARIVQVAVGVKDTCGLRFNAFGGLIPSCEQKDLLGILFPAACFSGRAPEKGMAFSFFIGGMKAERLTELPDKEIENLVVREFHEMLKFPAHIEPDMIHIARHTHAIPQYEKSTGERLEVIEKLQNRYPGLILAGNIRDGISMADRILQGTKIAGKL
ncbi:MAG: protoporphyrinogen oxidase [Dysgonamonadaceae bacterium]|jgi:oxygen-dependent protoporphyrinogen oxidase|nr:protoporphyrinogen oxidase [Dysgonamonadaceae bacterium]